VQTVVFNKNSLKRKKHQVIQLQQNQYNLPALLRFNISFREGYLKAVKRILSHLKTFPKGRVIIDTSYPDHSMYRDEDHSNWLEIPKDLPPEKGPRVRMTVYVDADHAHDLVTRRSITVILVMLNNTPNRWISKHQKTVETSTYDSELMSPRIATKLILEVRYASVIGCGIRWSIIDVRR
jgi:hypothetical protein